MTGERDRPASHREQKRVASAGLRRLAGRAEWNPAARPAGTAEARARELVLAEAADRTYRAADACDACAAAREASGDPTALCERHLAEALGLGGE